MLPKAVVDIISEYAKEYHIFEHINKKMINWTNVNRYTKCVDFLFTNPGYIILEDVICNEHAIDLIKIIPEKFELVQLCSIDCVDIITYVKQNIDKIYNIPETWLNLSKNPSGVDLIDIYAEKLLKINGLNLDGIVHNLCENPNGVSFIEKKLHKFGKKFCKTRMWETLNTNPSAFYLFKLFPDKINWITFATYQTNHECVPLLEKNIEKVRADEWFAILDNILYIDIVMKNLDKIINDPFWHMGLFCHFEELSKDKLDKYVPVIVKYLNMNNCEEYVKKNLWAYICENPNAVHIIEKNQDKINLQALCYNYNATHLIEKRLDEIKNDGWYNLSGNINGIYIMKDRLHKLKTLVEIEEKDFDYSAEGWHLLSKNPKAYDIIKKNMDKVCHCIFKNENPAIVNLLQNPLLYKQLTEENEEIQYWPPQDFYNELSRSSVIFDNNQKDIRKILLTTL